MLISVRIFIDGSDADGIRYFDELLPVSTVRTLLDPLAPAFFISVQSPARLKPPTVKKHLINSRYIREIMLFSELPGEERITTR